MRELKEMFISNMQNNEYWHSFEHDPDFSNAPKENGEYKVLVKLPLSFAIMEAKAIWNGCDWIVPNEGYEITALVFGWRKE